MFLLLAETPHPICGYATYERWTENEGISLYFSATAQCNTFFDYFPCCYRIEYTIYITAMARSAHLPYFFSVSLSLPKMSICRRYCAPMSIMFAWWFCAAFFPIKSGWSFLLFSALLYFPFHHWSDFLIFIWPEFYLFPRRSCLLFFPSFPRFSFPLKAMVLFMSIHHTIPYEFMKS